MLRVSGHSERTDVGRQRQANEGFPMARAPLSWSPTAWAVPRPARLPR